MRIQDHCRNRKGRKNAPFLGKSIKIVKSRWKNDINYCKSHWKNVAEDKDKPHIRACFNAIPKQLSKENKKYQYSKVERDGRGVFYKDSLQWLEDADIIRRCYNSNITGLPLEGNAIDNVFKV